MTEAGTSAQIILVGAGGHARVISDIVRLTGRFLIVGYLDDLNRDRHGAPLGDATILGGMEQLDRLAAGGVQYGFAAIGDCAARLAVAGRLAAAGFALPVLAHPSAIRASDVVVGDGTVLVAGSIVNSGARIGANVIVNTAASVDHDCTIDDGVHIACGARLAGNVHVGRGAWIGIGAVVKEGVRIGAGTVVGAGSLVLKDLPDGVVAYGAPATVVSHVSGHDTISH